MIPVKQTELYPPKGNCFEASIASIFELDLNQVPNFNDYNEFWWPRFLKWLTLKNFYAVVFMQEKHFPGYYLVMGTSPRNKDINHQVVYKNGEMIHDPHPDNTGLVDIKETILLVPINPAKGF